MSCAGLHCPGCSGGQSLIVLAAGVVALAAAAESVRWVAERIWWIGGTLAACFALSVAASIWLEAWHDRRAVAWGHARGIYSRADYIAAPPARAGLTPARVTIKRLGPPAPRLAATVRNAITGGKQR